MLFGVATWGFKPLHPAGFPMDALVEMAKIDTVAAMKYEGGGSALHSALAEIHRRVRRRAAHRRTRWRCTCPRRSPTTACAGSGRSGYESAGSRPIEVFNAAHAGDWDKAMEIFWSFQSHRDSKGAFHATFPGAGLIHRVGWKYMGWLQGMNGGLLRMPAMRLNPGQMKPLRAGVVASGFDVPGRRLRVLDGTALR